MDSHIIRNFSDLATNKLRQNALSIVEAGLAAIKTDLVIQNNIQLNNNVLKIKELTYGLNNFKHIYLIGIGKASADAAIELNKILGTKITAGIVIDIKTAEIPNPNIQIIKGTHPKPSTDNINATQKITDLTKLVTKEDLVICIISGGGSALLCANQAECDYGTAIYDQFVLKGGNINELNTLRKHISILKAGGLAKMLYPAQVVGLIFSDIPGGQIQDVASGPTFMDQTTLANVNSIIQKYQIELPSEITFVETPKQEDLFRHAQNVLLVSNTKAAEAMKTKAKELGFTTSIYSTNIADKIPDAARKLNSGLGINQALIAAGEPELVVYTNQMGKGGRNQQLTLESIPYLSANQVFISIGSDGIDNTEAAGAIIDDQTMVRIKELNLNYDEYKNSLNAFEIFEKLGDLIYTGPTGANVADLMLSIRE